MWGALDFSQGDDIDQDAGAEGRKRSAQVTIHGEFCYEFVS